MTKAVREKIIEHHGFTCAKTPTSHRGTVRIWRKIE